MSWIDDIDPAEAILPELAPYLTTTGSLALISHPLVHSILPMPALVNRQYRLAQQELERAARERDWRAWIGVHAKPYQMQALHELVEEGMLGRGDEPLITELLIGVWTIIENVWQMHEEIEALVEWIDRPTVEADPFMQSLPDILTVYRGHQGVNEAGYSWSADRVQAEWFARRFQSGHGEALIAERTISKTDILFATDQRGEREVVISP
jgi:hypothetical protein